LEALNRYYSKHCISFKAEGDIIKIIENPRYHIKGHKDLQNELKWKYNAIFKPTILWHIPKRDVIKLSSKRLKLSIYKTPVELRERVDYYLDCIQENQLRISLRNFLMEIDYLSNLPCTKIYHHAYEYGLLEHTVQLLDLATNIKETIGPEYPIDSDLLIAGCILHDAGKTNCYRKEDIDFEHTDISNKQGHIIHGIKLVTQYIQSDKLDSIIHIIASHHSEKDWGSPIPPAIPEAWIIHTMDNLSAKILG
jgi:putative nucleotidyltransferase with HDIG domain